MILTDGIGHGPWMVVERMETQIQIDPRSDSARFAPAGRDAEATRIVARTLFRDMVDNGLSEDQIIAVAAQLLANVTERIKDRRPVAAGTA
jgi:hypothetical protein